MSSNKRGRHRSKQPMIFDAWNYKVLALGIFLVIIGFAAMYIENEIQGFISLYVSPIVIMSGYLTVVVAILKHDQGTSKAS